MLLITLALPLIGALPLFFHKSCPDRARDSFALTVTILTSLCAAWCVLTPGDHALTLLRLTPTLTVSFRLDGLGRVFAGMIAFLWPLSTLYALEYMRREPNPSVFYGFYLLSYSVTLAIAFAEDLMTLYIFYELLSLATLFLVTHGMKPERVSAGRKYIYFMLGGAALGFLSLVTVIHFGGGSNFTPGGIPALRSAPLGLALAMFTLGFLGFGVKAAIFPFHSWLPSASVAPTPVTALLHAVAVVKAGAFAVIRLAYSCFGAALLRGTWAQTVCLSVAMVSIVYGSAMAVRERHAKRRLAYSTMSNLSYVLFGAMLLTSAGLRAGLLHMLFHALMKITLFSCVGAMMVQTGRSYIDEMRGLARKMPLTMAVFAFCAVQLVGIPPFIGFQSKWALASAAIAGGSALELAGVGALLVSAILTAIYMLIPTVSAYALPLSAPDTLPDACCDPGVCMKLPLLILCAVMLALVFFSAPLGDVLAVVAEGLM